MISSISNQIRTFSEKIHKNLVIILKRKQRVNFLNYLKRFNIFPFIGYVPLHKSTAGKKYLVKFKKLKNTDFFEKRIVRLPLHNHLSSNDIDYASRKIKDFFSK